MERVDEVVIRYDPHDRCVRSTNEPPGVICFGLDDDGDISYTVNQTWDPARVEETGIVLVSEDEAEVDESIPLSVACVVDGCADDDALEALWEMTMAYCRSAIDGALEVCNLRFARDVLDFTNRVAVEIFDPET